MRTVVAMAAALMVSACANVSYVLDEYGGIPPVDYVVDGDDNYRVFDKPQANKLMITPSYGRAMAGGFMKGATFGAADTAVPKPLFERAALGFLESTGRKCRILDGYMVLSPQWEFKYDCSIPAPPVMAAPVPSRQRR